MVGTSSQTFKRVMPLGLRTIPMIHVCRLNRGQ